MKFVIPTSLVFVAVLLLIYLLAPQPEYPPPLPNSVKSTEEGDTVQIPGVSAYYTDYQRAEVVKFYSDKFSSSPFLNLPFFQIKLNHPVEYSRQVIRDPFLASYVEEIVHPFRESLIIAGWEPVNAPTQLYNDQDRLPIIVGEKQFYGKATLRYFESNFAARIFIFILATGVGVAIFLNYKKIFSS